MSLIRTIGGLLFRNGGLAASTNCCCECPDGRPPCGEECCPNNKTCCTSPGDYKTCCPQEAICCGGLCCPEEPEQVCCEKRREDGDAPPSGGSDPTTGQNAGDPTSDYECCPKDDGCCCCPEGRDCCTIQANPQDPLDFDYICCKENESCCGQDCCPSGRDCCDNVCCPEDQFCCVETCCPDGRVCCGTSTAATCCPPGHQCIDGECTPCPEGQVQCGEVCCPEGQCCVDGVCAECECVEDADCGECSGTDIEFEFEGRRACCPAGSVGIVEDAGDARYGNCVSDLAPGNNVLGSPYYLDRCCDGVCTPLAPECGGECCLSPNVCCDDACCNVQGCQWETTGCTPVEGGTPLPGGGFTGTVCSATSSFKYESDQYEICAGVAGVLAGYQTVTQTVGATLPYGLGWKAGYPAALDPCPYAVVIDNAESTCCVGEIGSTEFKRVVRVLVRKCDGSLSDVTSSAVEGTSGDCYASTNIARESQTCGALCDNPSPSFLPFFPDPVFVCPP